MNNKRIFLIIFLAFFLSLIRIATKPSFATVLGVAEYVEIDDETAGTGSIIDFLDGKYALSKEPYSSKIFGVVAEDPAVAFDNNVAGSLPIISTGTVKVKVSSINGIVRKGELLTSSKIPGVAMRSDDAGQVVCIANENYTQEDPTKIGSVECNMSLKYVNSLQAKNQNFSLSGTLDGNKVLLKQLVSGSIVVLSFGLGFLAFSKTTSKGIEAIGRNPMAKGTVALGMVLNSVLIIGIMLVGVVIAYLVFNINI